MKGFILSCFITLNLNLIAQESTILDSTHGVVLSYTLTRTEEGSNKDSYLIQVTAENKNDYDVYYGIHMVKENGRYNFPSLQNLNFAEVYIKSKGITGTHINLKGNPTLYVTDDNNGKSASQGLFALPKKSSISIKKVFRAKKGQSPIVSHKKFKSFKKIESFNL